MTTAATTSVGGSGADPEPASCGESAPSSFEEKAPAIESFGESEDAASLKDGAAAKDGVTAAAAAATSAAMNQQHHHHHHHLKDGALSLSRASADEEGEELVEDEEEDDEEAATRFETDKFTPQLKLLYAFAKELDDQRGS